MKHQESLSLAHSSYLAHHGIMGMHWGVKNGPPYPLDKKLSLRIQKGHNEKARYTAKELKDMRSGKIKTTKKDRVGRTHRSSEREYKRIQGLNASDLSSFANIGTLLVNGDLPESSIRTLDRPKRRVVDADIMAVNPGLYDPETANDRGYSNNCGLCSTALALRAMGYDVQASRATNGTLISSAQYYFDGAIPYKEKDPSNIQKRLESFGAEGLGVLSIARANGAGHAVYFQNERQPDGSYKPVIIDGQARKKYTSLEAFLQAEGADIRQFTTITRLDRATPNWSHIGEDSAVLSTHSKKGMQAVFTPNSGLTYDSGNVRFQDSQGRAGFTWETKSDRPVQWAEESSDAGLRSVKRENVNERSSKKTSNLALDRSRWTDSISNLFPGGSSTAVKDLPLDSKQELASGQIGRMLSMMTNTKTKLSDDTLSSYRSYRLRTGDDVDNTRRASLTYMDNAETNGKGDRYYQDKLAKNATDDYYNRSAFRKNDDGVFQRRVTAKYAPASDFTASLRDAFSKPVKDISTTKSSSVGNLGNIDDFISKWKDTSIDGFVGNDRTGKTVSSNRELISELSRMYSRRSWD